MKRTLILWVLLLGVSMAHAQVNAPMGEGTEVSDPIVPGNIYEAHNGTHYANWGVGGMHQVQRVTQRDSIYDYIITNRGQEIYGTMCYVVDSSKYYTYTATGWVEFETGEAGIDSTLLWTKYDQDTLLANSIDIETDSFDLAGRWIYSDIIEYDISFATFDPLQIPDYRTVVNIADTAGKWFDTSTGDNIYYSDSVGIGRSIPNYRLDVNGDINVDGVRIHGVETIPVFDTVMIDVVSIGDANLKFGGVIVMDSEFIVKKIFKMPLVDTSQSAYKVDESVVINSADTSNWVWFGKWKKL